ncbi:hypothetical protein DXB59_15390 [Ruminococcus sp. OM05-10BH]|nr:hypothetical protein DXB59_15390 [Ruminococcus sp. OM05-10BH]
MFFQRAAVWCEAAGQTLPTRLGVLLVNSSSRKRVFPLQMRVRRSADGRRRVVPRGLSWLSSLGYVQRRKFFYSIDNLMDLSGSFCGYKRKHKMVIILCKEEIKDADTL